LFTHGIQDIVWKRSTQAAPGRAFPPARGLTKEKHVETKKSDWPIAFLLSVWSICGTALAIWWTR
jgi:hypothetical protein